MQNTWNISSRRWVLALTLDVLWASPKSVVLAKLMYASPAWWGYATAADKKHILKHLFDEECGLVSIMPTIQRRRNWPSTATTNSSAAY